MAIDPAITDYYEHFEEEDRLEGGVSLEAIRTRELLVRHLPPPPAVVYDIGGAAGAYAFWLSERGYDVHLVDASPRLVEEARRRNAQRTDTRLASCEVGDARSLQFTDATADVVLMLGPLYHLTAREDRVKALQAARRLLRPGGLLAAAAISRWASAMDGLARGLFSDPAFAAIVEQDLRDGQHRNPTGRREYFTTAYFHRPEDLRQEAVDAGLHVTAVYGVEGPGWILPDERERLADARRREDLLRAARQLESEPSVMGASAHLLLVCETRTKHAAPST